MADVQHAYSIWSQLNSTIVYTFATLVQGQVLLLADAFEIAIASIFVLFLYILVDPWLRRFISEVLAQDNGPLDALLREMLDFILKMGIILTAIFLAHIIKVMMDAGNLSFLEMVVTVFSLLLVGAEGIHTIQQLSAADATDAAVSSEYKSFSQKKSGGDNKESGKIEKIKASYYAPKTKNVQVRLLQ